MGGIVDSIFGGGAAKEAKKATKFQKEIWDWGKGQATPYLSGGSGAFGALGGILGMGGTAEQDAAFNNYMDSTGYEFLLDSGSRAITGNMAAKGLLNSGATAKALTTFGQNLASTKTAEYMNALLGMSQIGSNTLSGMMGAGNQAAGNIAQIGQAKAGAKADAWGSLFNLGTSIGGAIAMSDRRLKVGVEKIGEFADGLGLYLYRYITGGPLQWGFMADEVERLQPFALGPTIGGYKSVDYALVRG